MLDHLPDTLSAELNLLGAGGGGGSGGVGNEKQKVERDYTFKKPNLDEHGEPDF